MNPKKPRDKRELCYPFIFETALTCDFEIATDELCCQVGAVLSYLVPDGNTKPMLADLAALQRLIYNLNGSVRGKLGIFDADLEWLKARYDHYNEASRGAGDRIRAATRAAAYPDPPSLSLRQQKGGAVAGAP